MPYDVSIALDGSARRLDPEPYVALIEGWLAGEGVADGAVALLFADDELLLRLNREHRGIEDFTDVLAFPADEGETLPAAGDEEPLPYFGDIAVAVGAVRRQADEAGLTFEKEFRHVLLHALLHLLGHTHEAADDAVAMREREEVVLGPGIHAAGGGHGRHDDRRD